MEPVTDRNPSAPPQIFDDALLRLRETRAARRRAGDPGFLLTRMLDDLAERICDVNRQFKDAVLIAPDGCTQALLDSLPADRRPDTLTTRTPSEHTHLNLDPQSQDLMIALLGPGQVNDLPGALIEMRQSLRPDGLCLSAWLGGESLKELRTALYSFDQAQKDGLTPRVHPLVGHTEAANLLSRAGFALPVVDFDRFTVRYRALSTLINDLRDLGLTNALHTRDRTFLGHDALDQIQDAYPIEDSKFPATFHILWTTGWAPHDSQQKPLKPGSAKTRLADALGVKERKL
jgi:hypothetical protein